MAKNRGSRHLFELLVLLLLPNQLSTFGLAPFGAELNLIPAPLPLLTPHHVSFAVHAGLDGLADAAVEDEAGGHFHGNH